MQIKYETEGMEKLKAEIESMKNEAENLRKESVNIYEPVSGQLSPRSISLINEIVYNEIEYYCNTITSKVATYRTMIHDLKETAIEVDENIAIEESKGINGTK